MLQESAAFAQAASLDTHKALVHIFFAQRATKKASQHSVTSHVPLSSCGPYGRGENISLLHIFCW